MAECAKITKVIEGCKEKTYGVRDEYRVSGHAARIILENVEEKRIPEIRTSSVDVTIQDPVNNLNVHTITTSPRPWPHHGSFALTAAFLSKPQLLDVSVVHPVPTSSLTASFLANHLLQSTFDYDSVHQTFTYKKVANKVKLVATTMPAHARIIRTFPEDPLLSLPHLSSAPSKFVPGTCLTQQCMDNLSIFQNMFLSPEEQKLAACVLMNNKFALAWDETEKGHFCDDYFPPIVIPTIEHIP
ncbi:hypothetical protein EDD22DRAFT_958769 [Suillus occidentalis]|nr:hypothetical protein EDD22DRAFT_958769 [Suillus occidentalis]